MANSRKSPEDSFPVILPPGPLIKILRGICFLFFLGTCSIGFAANKTYCLQVNYSAVPSLVNYRKISLIVNVGTCASVSVTADGAPVSAAYSSSAGTALFTTTGSSILVTAVNWTAGGTGAATKATLYNNYHWAYSLTFDDNRLSQYDYGKPLLDALGWRAGEAVVGSWANEGGASGSGSYFMNWTCLQALRAAGWDMYDHSYDHPNPLTCNGTATDIGTELSNNQPLLLKYFPGYNVTQMVFPYEVSTANTCPGYPTSYLLSAECGGGSYNFVDTALPFQAQRGGLFGTDDTAWKSLAAAAAGNSRPTWLIEYTHSVSQGSGAIADEYSTNQTTLTDLLNYLNTTFGTAGNQSMWFAPAGEVRDYVFTRDNSVISVCTPVVTPGPTATLTKTNTPTATNTPTKTNSPSNTATLTFTKTATASNTVTPSNTATKTNTLMNTTTFTSTATSTPSRTATPLATHTATSTATASMTATPSYTNSGTASPTPSWTATATSTATSQSTSTETSTPTSSFTRTQTSTATLTFSPTYSLTATSSFTPSSTRTPPPTFTPSWTSTPSASSTSTPSSTSSFTQTFSFTPVFTMTNTPTSTFSNTASSTSTFTLTHTATATFTPTPSFTKTSTPTPTSTSTATNTPSFTFTPTFSRTFTSTPSFTVTSTFTHTFTATFSPTATFTFTDTPTFTRTPTATETPTSTVASTVPVLYPNPVDGTRPVTVFVPGLTGNSQVLLQIYTTAFRKVWSKPYSVTPGFPYVDFNLEDSSGAPLANGLYYVVLTTARYRDVLKLMVLR